MKHLILAIVIIPLIFSAALADGFVVPIMPRPVPPDFPPNPLLNVKYHHVDVEINDPVAITKIDQVFVNPFRRVIEANYIFPIPENAAIDRFTAWLDGKKMEAELLDADQARRIYEDIVRRRRDPALLEYADRGMYRMRIFPIPAGGEVRIKIEYKQTLKSDYGSVEYIYPLNTEKYSGSKLEDCNVEINLNSFEEIGTVYCPSHSTKNVRINEKKYQIVYHDENVRPDKDLVLYFTRQKKDFGFHLLSYRERRDNQGYFLGILSPPLDRDLPDIPKNMIFVLDSSGSMKGDKFKQAMAALEFVIQDLNDGDKFNMIDYDDEVRPYKEGLVDATAANIEKALAYARDYYEAGGGTNIYDVLETACRMIPRNGDPTYILFLTDGLPTVGTRDIDKIVKNTTELNANRARLFVFGVGYDVNAHLLDRLAQENSGVPEYVLPDEDIEVKVSRLAQKISRPALTDVKLSFVNSQLDRAYPNPVPDLFYGSEIIITGRYDKSGTDQAVIRGKLGTREVTYEFPVEFRDGSTKDEFIALLWANRRIAYLTQQVRLHGENDELIDEIIALSKKYGIVTEYTSFLVTGDEHYAAEDIFFRGDRAHLRTAYRERIGEYKSSSGKSAVTQSQNYANMGNAKQAYDNFAMDVSESEISRQFSQVGAQNFVNVSGNWVQGDLDKDSYDIEIKNFSPAYFQVLENDPSLGRYLGLGQQVRIQIGTQVVQFSDEGKENLSKEELKQLFPH